MSVTKRYPRKNKLKPGSRGRNRSLQSQNHSPWRSDGLREVGVQAGSWPEMWKSRNAEKDYNLSIIKPMMSKNLWVWKLTLELGARRGQQRGGWEEQTSFSLIRIHLEPRPAFIGGQGGQHVCRRMCIINRDLALLLVSNASCLLTFYSVCSLFQAFYRQSTMPFKIVTCHLFSCEYFKKASIKSEFYFKDSLT